MPPLYKCTSCNFQGTMDQFPSWSEEGDNYTSVIAVKCPSCNQVFENARDHPKRID